MINISELIKKPEYKWLDEYKDRLCFLCIGGSHGYGTNIEGSDIDLRGVMLPTKEDLIGLNTFNQKLDDNTDTCIYEFNRFVKLAMDNNPNVLELLGCKDYLIFNDVGKQLINNQKLFLSKKCINTFGGYAVSQLRRLENALCHTEYTEAERSKYIQQTMQVAMNKLEESNDIFKEQCIKIKNENDCLFMDIDINHQPIQKIRSALNDILNIENTYNKLNQRNRKVDDKHLNKHIMHLIRLYLTCFDILEKGKIITYRENDRDFLLDIRNGKYLIDRKLDDSFYIKLKELESRMDADAKLDVIPSKPRYKEVEKFVIEINSMIIKDNINRYKDPLEIEINYEK